MTFTTMTRAAAIGAVILAGGSLVARAQTPAPSAADLAMSCQQITDGVTAQNQVLKEQNDYQTQLNSKQPDPGDPDPRVLTRVSQIKSAKAKARADTLVAAGRQKKCFQ